jgi:hypothetical protein
MPLPHSDQHNIHCTYMVLLKGRRGLYMGLKSEKYYPMCIKQSLTKKYRNLLRHFINDSLQCNFCKVLQETKKILSDLIYSTDINSSKYLQSLPARTVRFGPSILQNCSCSPWIHLKKTEGKIRCTTNKQSIYPWIHLKKQKVKSDAQPINNQSTLQMNTIAMARQIRSLTSLLPHWNLTSSCSKTTRKPLRT